MEQINGTVHFILLAETWVKNKYEAKSLKLNNYTHYYNFRTDKIGGGVSIFAHNDITHQLSEESYSQGNNFLWIHVDKLCLDIGVLYKPGYTNVDNFIEMYEAQLKKRRRAIIFGDFNLDLLQKDTNINKYKSMLSGTNYFLINNTKEIYYTRCDKSQRKSILDHVCCNFNNNDFHMSLIDSSMSDHRQIYLGIKKTWHNVKHKYKYEAVDYKKLKKLVEDRPCKNIVEYSILEKYIYDNINKCINNVNRKTKK